MKKPQKYRDFIDQMVDVCHNGQGQYGSKAFLKGIWNANANNKKLRENNEDLQNQYEINLLLEKLSKPERQRIAEMLEEAFRGGVFETLKYLEEFEIEPFVDGYEGSPYHDFIGRVYKPDPWNWPEK